MAIAEHDVVLKAAEGLDGGMTKTSGTESHSGRDCPAARIARAYAELHRLTHGRPVAGCPLPPCASLGPAETDR